MGTTDLVWFYGTSSILGHYAKSILIHINSSISNNSVLHKYTVLMSKTVLFQTIQFSTSIVFLFTHIFNVKNVTHIFNVLFQTSQFSISIVFCLYTVK